MEFRDLNEIDFLTIKSDFLLDICDQGNDIRKNLGLIKNLGIEYNEVFKMILRAIETLRYKLADGVVEKIFDILKEVFEINDGIFDAYVNLLNCYVKCDIENYNLKEIYTNEFANNTTIEFNMLFAPYYLQVLVERFGDIDEINRVNNILKDAIKQYKNIYGR